MSNSSPNVAWQCHQVPSCKRIHLSFAWNQHQSPLADDVKNNSLLLLQSTTHWKIFWCPLANLLMPTGCWRCPLANFTGFFETFSLTTTVNFIDIFPPLSVERRDTSLENIPELPPFRCRSFALFYSPIQLHESTLIFSVWATQCVIICGCRTEAIF